jgi:hypothetical protein
MWRARAKIQRRGAQVTQDSPAVEVRDNRADLSIRAALL